MKNKKKILLLSVCVLSLLCGSLCGCSKEDVIKTKEDKSKAVKEEQMEDGIYIRTKKGKFYKPNTDNQSFSGVGTQAGSDRVIWNTSGNKAIPTLYKDDELVCFSAQALTEDYVIEKFSPSGYSIGVYGLEKGTDGNINMTSNMMVKDSSLYTAMMEKKGVLQEKGSIVIAELEGKKVKESDLKRGGILSGLEKDKSYTVGFFKGTYYTELKLKADTRFFVSKETDTIGGYQYTKSGYAIIDTSSLEEGYYSVNGEGLFHVVNKNR